MATTIPGRVVIAGGHDSWRRVIKHELSGVKYIDRNTKHFDQALIQNADAIWIQRNSIGHSQFYRIVHLARAYNVPVRYFGYASVQKCIAQLMGGIS